MESRVGYERDTSAVQLPDLMEMFLYLDHTLLSYSSSQSLKLGSKGDVTVLMLDWPASQAILSCLSSDQFTSNGQNDLDSDSDDVQLEQGRSTTTARAG